MRGVLIVIGGVIGMIVLIVAGVIGYAYLNLNSIIAANRERLLARASDAIGRPVEAAEIKASLGRGVSIEITGVKLDDDPNFSQLPFVQADKVFLKVEFIPLLFKEIKVTELVLSQPQIRIIRNPAGTMNVSTMARKGAARGITIVTSPEEAGSAAAWDRAVPAAKRGAAGSICTSRPLRSRTVKSPISTRSPAPRQ